MPNLYQLVSRKDPIGHHSTSMLKSLLSYIILIVVLKNIKLPVIRFKFNKMYLTGRSYSCYNDSIAFGVTILPFLF